MSSGSVKTKLIFLLGGFLLLTTIVVSLKLLNFPYQLLCRHKFLSPLSTGPGKGLFVKTIKYLELLNTRTCIVSTTEKSDELFPNSSVRLKIGYFDRNGLLHIYPARMGGADFDGNEQKMSMCFPPIGEMKPKICRIIDADESLSNLKPGKIVEAKIIFRDTAPWLLAAQNKKYQEFFEKLKVAIQQGYGFPPPPNDKQFAIQIWQIDLAP